ncbi:MAG: tRNA uridine-5-carboxymethylaminomethyl(34) synthesis GTPase MnmE, partial [Tissierellia bacterium]|nr:tRNA uridine-5-carboxymethylaminomethyl(34) synthesis GTPase MnmE [Tissierellia bacterium]
EAVIDMIKAKTDKAYDASLNQLEGSLKNKIGNYRDKMLNILARLEYSINFTEDFLEEPDISPVIKESEEVLEGLKKLYNSSNKGKIIRDGIETAIIGKPNVGKSSLLNALIKEKKAIVTDIPGTTRDVVEEYIDLDGIALKISDTAGIRDTEDIVEKLGVDKSLEFIDKADLIIAMFDVSRDFDEEDRKIFNLIENKNAIVVFNKIDILKEDIDIEKYEKKYPIIKMSVKKDNGIEDLEKYIMEMFFKGDIISTNETLVTNVRHRDLIEKAIKSLSSAVEDLKMDIPIDCIEVDIRETWDILGQITGDTVEDDILNKIFQDFCVGK